MPRPLPWFSDSDGSQGIDPLLPGSSRIPIKPFLYQYDEYQTYDVFFVERISSVVLKIIFRDFPENFLAKARGGLNLVAKEIDILRISVTFSQPGTKLIVLIERFTPWSYPWADDYTTQLFNFFDSFTGTDYYNDPRATGELKCVSIERYSYGYSVEWNRFIPDFGHVEIMPVVFDCSRFETKNTVEITLPATSKQEAVVITYLYGDIDDCYKKLYKQYQTYDQPKTIKFDFSNCLICSVVVSSTDNSIKNYIDGQFNQESKGYLYDNLDELLSYAKENILANMPRLYYILTRVDLDISFVNFTKIVPTVSNNVHGSVIDYECNVTGVNTRAILFEPKPEWYKFAGVYFANNNYWNNGTVKPDLGVAIPPSGGAENWLHDYSFLDSMSPERPGPSPPPAVVTYPGFALYDSNPPAEGTPTTLYLTGGNAIDITASPGGKLVQWTYGNSILRNGITSFMRQGGERPSSGTILVRVFISYFRYIRLQEDNTYTVQAEIISVTGKHHAEKDKGIVHASGAGSISQNASLSLGRRLRQSIQPFDNPNLITYQQAIESVDLRHYSSDNFEELNYTVRYRNKKYYYRIGSSAREYGLEDMPDTIRIKEIHQALEAQKFAYDDSATDNRRVANIGYYIERVARVLGISINPNGTQRSIRQKAKLPAGSTIPPGWDYAQFALNQGDSPVGQQGGDINEVRDGIVYETRCNKIIPNKYNPKKSTISTGDLVLCENLPQLIDEILDDLDKALGWQELGANAIPAADNSGSYATFEGLAALQAELAFMLSKISIDSSQGLISSLITQAVSYEILSAFGQPIKTKSFALKADANKTGQVPYPGLSDDAPSVMAQTGWILQNLAPIVGSLIKQKEIERPQVQNSRKIELEKKRAERVQKDNQDAENIGDKARGLFERFLGDK